jgi:hypothetical protein
MSNEPAKNPSSRSPRFKNWLSLAGAVVVAGSVFSFVLLVALDLFRSFAG